MKQGEKYATLPDVATDKPKLIVVDDEPDMLDFVLRALRESYHVTACRTGEQVLEHLEKEQFDVLITDQQMPGISGIDLLDRLSTIAPNMVKVLMSGFADVSEMHRLVRDCGIHGVVVKPIDSQTLLAAIARAYEVKGGQPFEPPE